MLPSVTTQMDMVPIRLVPFILLLPYPVYIRGYDGDSGNLQTEDRKKRADDSLFEEPGWNLAQQEEEIDESVDVLRAAHGNLNQARSCAEIEDGHACGVHDIHPNSSYSIPAKCETRAGGGWTVIQKRFDGSVDFFRGWEEYAQGFGDLAGEHWLGLRHIHALTKAQPMVLYVGVTDFELGLKYAKYMSFSVSSEEDKFRLHIGNYTGDAGDSLRYHDGANFSTKDQDNDAWKGGSCSETRHGGWWYKHCAMTNLNGWFSRHQVSGAWNYMTWYKLHRNWNSMKTSVMMIRPADFKPSS